MSSIRLRISQHCIRRTNIEYSFQFATDYILRDRAVREYEELLETESSFGTKYPDQLLTVQRKYKNPLPQSSYTAYGQSLSRKYPNSSLLKLICKVYERNPVRDVQQAMVDFETLKEMQITYSSLLKKSDFSNTDYQTRDKTSGKDARSHIHSNSIHGMPGHPPDDRQSMAVSQTTLNINGIVYYPEQMYKQLETRTHQQQDDLTRLQNEIKAKTKDLDDLRSRLSGLASKQLTKGNPDFTDLSDKNRPIKIAEFFHSIYDDEWTSALEALTDGKKGSSLQVEESAITFLTEILKTGYAFCSNYADRQRKNMHDLWLSCLTDPFKSAYSVEQPLSASYPVPDAIIDGFKEMRRARPYECITSAVKAFRYDILGNLDFYKTKKGPAVDAYADKCIEIIWLMRIQDPPMFMQWPAIGEKIQQEYYKDYCRKGSVVKLAVWPAVFLHENGALMNKGFVMPQ